MITRLRVLWADVETKLKAAVTSSTVAAAAVWVLGTYVYAGQVPATVREGIDVAAPVVAGAVAGWLAKHTPKSAPAPVVNVTPTPVDPPTPAA